jgi:hypothetical protein
MNFRTLKANEIDCRISTINDKGLSLLLYKDARVDQNILDETVGSMNWQRKHTRDNANCIVSIWDSNKSQWIEKEDTGTESFSEAEKGLASDSFKRACFNWGIGRELYTAPFIWITSEGAKIEKNDNGKFTCKDNFVVDEIDYNESKEIIKLKIRNKTKRVVVFEYDNTNKNETDRLSLISQFEKLIIETGTDKELIYETYKVENNTQMTNAQLEQAIRKMKGKKK